MTSSIQSESLTSSFSSCSIRLPTLVKKFNFAIPNHKNARIISDFHRYMQDKGSSENHQVNNLKVVMDYAKFLGPISFYDIKDREQIISFLNKKMKPPEVDPDRRCITTWNHYLNRIKLFTRWLYNYHLQHKQDFQNEEWITPDFCKIKPKQSKRISPYLESEIWDRDELLTIIKYEPYTRNKAILALMWDLDARPHEITLLKIKHIRLKERYGEGEIPHEAKTGTGPILLSISFPYVRDWLNEHPFRNELNASLICNLHNGAPIKPKAIWNMMSQLHNRIIRLLKNSEVTNKQECEKLEYLLKTKKWNPYCIRHSAITSDSDYLPEYALKKKVRWSMNSKQGSRYIKRRMGDELKNKILEHNGIFSELDDKKKPSILNCPRCELVNAIENKFCSKCSYPLVPTAYDEIKEAEERRLKKMEEQIQFLLETQKDLLELQKYPERLAQIASLTE